MLEAQVTRQLLLQAKETAVAEPGLVAVAVKVQFPAIVVGTVTEYEEPAAPVAEAVPVEELGPLPLIVTPVAPFGITPVTVQEPTTQVAVGALGDAGACQTATAAGKLKGTWVPDASLIKLKLKLQSPLGESAEGKVKLHPPPAEETGIS